MRDILKEIKEGSYAVSPTRLARIEKDPMEFLDTSFKGNFYTRRGSAFEELLTEGELTSFEVISGREPDPGAKIWTLIDPLSELVLGGHTIEESFETASNMSGYMVNISTVKKYFEPYQEWFEGYVEALMEGKESITNATFQAISKMRDNYMKDPFLKSLLDADFQFKVEFEHKGWKCKGFLDRWSDKDGILVDFKTTTRDYRSVPVEQRYDLQASFYKTGLEYMDREVKDVYFIVCSAKPPYKVYPIKFRERDLEVGRKGGLAYSLYNEVVYNRKYPKVGLKEVLGFEDLLDRLSWHVENGFDKIYDGDDIYNSNMYL